MKIKFLIPKWKKKKIKILHVKKTSNNINQKTSFSFFFFVNATKKCFSEIVGYMTKLYDDVFHIKSVWLSLTLNQISTESINQNETKNFFLVWLKHRKCFWQIFWIIKSTVKDSILQIDFLLLLHEEKKHKFVIFINL